MEWYRAKFIKTGSFGPVKHAMVRRWWWWCCFSSFAMMISSSSSSSSSIFLRSQKRIFGLKVCLWESFDAEQHTSKRVLSLSLPNDGRTPRVVFFFRKGSANRFSLSLPFFAKHKQQIGTFVLAFGLEHYMHHKYHSHHHHDEAHQSEEERKNVGGHSPKEFSAETASLDEITKEMTRLRKRVGELRKEGKHV